MVFIQDFYIGYSGGLLCNIIIKKTTLRKEFCHIPETKMGTAHIPLSLVLVLVMVCLSLIGIKDSIIENSRIFQTYLHELSSPRLPWRKAGKNKFQLNWHKRPFPGRKMRVGGHLYWTLRWTFHKLFHSIWLLHIIVEPCYMYIKCYLEAII